MDDAQSRLDDFLARFTPEVEALARHLIARMRDRLPGAAIIVYDNYNSLAIGFGPTEKPSHAVVSLAVFPRWVTLHFLDGVGLPDPHGILRGAGSRVRHVRLHDRNALDDARVEALIAEAVARSEPPFDTAAEQRLVIKSVSPKQRPRRPRGAASEASPPAPPPSPPGTG
ncbi:MAG TPA: DUF1801 domain-containing protein [Allosphingosinicella sp.]|nr:DUF1801 domain-containing protein [Allosphingosinicella sp.]